MPLSRTVLWPCAWHPHLLSHSSGGENQVDSWSGGGGGRHFFGVLWNVLERMILGKYLFPVSPTEVKVDLDSNIQVCASSEFLHLLGTWVESYLCEFSQRKLRTLVSLTPGDELIWDQDRDTVREQLVKRFQMHLQKVSFSYRNSPFWLSIKELEDFFPLIRNPNPVFGLNPVN